MGQYYQPIILTKKEVIRFSPHKYNEGAKIMEHSYFNTPMVGLVMKYLHDKKRDDPHLVWQGDYGEVLYIEVGKNQYDVKYLPSSDNVPKMTDTVFYRYIVNLDKGEYVDLVKCRERSDIHPLPLLTANGNGQGCGDYFGPRMELVGSWAGDHISVSDDRNDIAGKKEIEAYFNEDE